MAQNLATKYAKKVAERFSLKSLTDAAVNKDYDWTGVVTVEVYSVDVPSMNNYSRTGSARYGTASELGTTKDTLTLSRDRSFTFTIDRGNWNESQMVQEAGKSLARTIDEVVVPEIDVYRLAAMATAAISNGHWTPNYDPVSASNAYQIVLEMGELLDEDKVPTTRRVLFVSPAFYKYLKLDDDFTFASEIAAKRVINGQVGEADGNAVVKVPSSYFPTEVDAILAHPSVTVAPQKLEDYKTHDNPPGINGWLVEGRIIYDAFCLDAKVNGLAVHTTTPSS